MGKWRMFIWHLRVGFTVKKWIGQLRRNFVEAFIRLEPILPIHFIFLIYFQFNVFYFSDKLTIIIKVISCGYDEK